MVVGVTDPDAVAAAIRDPIQPDTMVSRDRFFDKEDREFGSSIHRD